jgi:large subunit ribosomal protein L23
MAILDVFKKKEEKEKELASEAEIKVAEEKKEDKQVKQAQTDIDKVNKFARDAAVINRKEFSQIAAKVLRAPHVTEKAINLGQQNKYIFKVSSDANKIEVKKAVQELYGVGVQDVNIINIPRRKKRVGAREGFKPGFKKAVVTLREGDKIDTGM